MSAVLEAIFTGVAKEGMTARLVRVYHTSDCAAIGYTGAELSGSGIAIGLQSRGTTVIHKKGLPRLHNLELFSFSPSMTLEIYEGDRAQRSQICAKARRSGRSSPCGRQLGAPEADRQDCAVAPPRDRRDAKTKSRRKCFLIGSRMCNG